MTDSSAIEGTTRAGEGAAGERLRGLLWYAWHEMNAIRAETGVPVGANGYTKGIVYEYWSGLVDAMRDELGDDAKPWPSDAAKAIRFPYQDSQNAEESK